MSKFQIIFYLIILVTLIMNWMKIIGYGSKLSVEKVYSKKKKSVEKEKKIKNLNKTNIVGNVH